MKTPHQLPATAPDAALTPAPAGPRSLLERLSPRGRAMDRFARDADAAAERARIEASRDLRIDQIAFAKTEIATAMVNRGVSRIGALSADLSNAMEGVTDMVKGASLDHTVRRTLERNARLADIQAKQDAGLLSAEDAALHRHFIEEDYQETQLATRRRQKQTVATLSDMSDAALDGIRCAASDLQARHRGGRS